MNIASKEFLFEFTSNNIILPDYFTSNEDYKINFEKALSSQREVEVDVLLDICKDEYISFYNYILIDLDSTKRLFYANLNIDGEYKKLLCDIVSNIKVVAKNNNFTITFKLVIK